MQSQAIVEGWKGVMYVNGLGTPMNRAFTAAVLTGIIAGVMKYPTKGWGRDGKMRPLRGLSARGDAVGVRDHFLTYPLLAGLAAATLI